MNVGSADVSELSQGEVNFLFTNLEGSAVLWEQQPEAMPLALAHHDAIIEAAVKGNHGHIFQHLGDSVCAAFDTADEALGAALAVQRGFATKPWGERRLAVRVALHSGPAEVRGSEYFGPPTLNRLARMLVVAHPGQILLSATTFKLVAKQLPANVTARDLGERRLRDLSPQHIYQLLAADLPADFPPLKSLDARPTNLPAQSTSFIGRQQEQRAVATLLRQPQVRLVTLLGTGGSGKTRLSIQVAANLLDEYADGAWFVPLAAINDAQLVASTIAQTLGLKERAGASLTDSLKDYLSERQLLLVLDNFEQVVAAAPLLDELLAAAPALKLLVSSREALHLPAEHEYLVPPLALPDLSHLPPAAALADYAAVALFVQRAQATRIDFALTTHNAAAVAEICARLDGLPLAIELAAARIKMFSPVEMLIRLDNRLTLLISTARDRSARQQSLRGMIDWSYDLLTPAEQQLFTRLAVFVGGFTVVAAEVICADFGLPISDFGLDEGDATLETTPPPKSQIPNPKPSVLELLSSLADKSLLLVVTPSPIQEPGQGENEPRFAMLETIREYALEKLNESERLGMPNAIREYARQKLVASGEEAALRQRHANYYAMFAEQAGPQVSGPHYREWLTRLEQEHDNLRAAINWSLEYEEMQLALRLGGALWPFWEVHGYLSEGRRLLQATLAGPAPANLRRAQALDGAAALAINQGDYDTALALIDEGVTIAREVGDKRTIAMLLAHKGSLASSHGDEATASTYYDECLTLSREVGYKAGVATSLQGLGRAAFYRGNVATCARLQAEALVISRELGDQRSTARLLDNLGVIKIEQGDTAGAWVNHEESLKIHRELGDRQNISFTLNNMGDMAMKRGDYERASALLDEALAIRQAMGDKLGIARTNNNLAQVAAAQGDYTRSFDLFAVSVRLLQQLGVKREIVNALEHLAKLAATGGQGEPAAQLLGASEALREAIATPLPRSLRPEYEQDLAATRALLDDDAFAHAWATGRAMSMELAIDYALSREE